MDNRGEFEAGPVEARPSVVYKRKSSPVVLVMMIVFALAAIGLGTALVMTLMNKPKSEGTSANEEGGGTISSAEATDAADGFSWHKNEDVILDLVDEMAESGYDYRIQHEYNIGGGATFEIRDGLLTSSFVSYGASITETTSGEINAMRSYAEKVLIKHGMKKDDSKNERDDGLNYIGDDGITCWISSVYSVSLANLNSFSYDCSDDSWITDEDKALDIALADAYNASEQGKKYKLDYIFAQARNIKKNAAGTYETIEVALSDAAGLFYRKVGGDWKFFTGAQAEVPCEYYNNAELKEVYAGVKCYDNATKQDTVVK